MVNSLKVGIIF